MYGKCLTLSSWQVVWVQKMVMEISLCLGKNEAADIDTQ